MNPVAMPVDSRGRVPLCTPPVATPLLVLHRLVIDSSVEQNQMT